MDWDTKFKRFRRRVKWNRLLRSFSAMEEAFNHAYERMLKFSDLTKDLPLPQPELPCHWPEQTEIQIREYKGKVVVSSD